MSNHVCGWLMMLQKSMNKLTVLEYKEKMDVLKQSETTVYKSGIIANRNDSFVSLT